MRCKDSTENKGIAFVNFRTNELASTASEELNNTQLKGRRIKCSTSQRNYFCIPINENLIKAKRENFNAKWQEIESTQVLDGESGYNKTSDIEDWVKEHRTKKGRVYGLGSEATKYKGSCSSGSVIQATQDMSPSIAPGKVNEAFLKAIDEQRRESEELRAKMAGVMKVMERQHKKIKKLKKN